LGAPADPARPLPAPPHPLPMRRVAPVLPAPSLIRLFRNDGDFVVPEEIAGSRARFSQIPVISEAAGCAGGAFRGERARGGDQCEAGQTQKNPAIRG